MTLIMNISYVWVYQIDYLIIFIIFRNPEDIEIKLNKKNLPFINLQYCVHEFRETSELEDITIPTECADLSEVTELILYENKISSIEPHTFDHLIKLEKLYLDQNSNVVT